MARFYVGQRVRIKWSRCFPSLAGHVGTITGRGEITFPGSPYFGLPGWNVRPDGWDSEIGYSEVCGRTVQFCPREEQLEPATDANDKIEWSECVWQPEHLRVGA